MTVRRTGLPEALDPGYLVVKRQIIDRTGHHYYEDKDELLFDRVRRRVLATGVRGFESYCEILDDPDVGPAEWSALVSEITIGETFFFRYAEQFAALSASILPDILARNRQRRSIRVWSAGCSTGAEAYSVAILLTQALGEALDDWTVTIVGTDIDEAVLQTARSGVFGRWALRSLGEEERRRWFEPGERANSFALKPAFRRMVRFERHNLLSLADGSSPLQFTDFDLILCRNVLIYFRPDAVEEIVAGLGSCLADDGWLLLGHAESLPAYTRSLATVDLPGALAYRRPSADVAPAAAVEAAAFADPLVPPPAPVPPPHRRPVRALLPRQPMAEPGPPPPAHGPDGGDRLAAVRSLADAGDLERALGACRAAQAAAPTDARLHYYEGLILRALDVPADAGSAFRKAVYLDRSFVLARYQLGLALIDGGEVAAGRRAVTEAVRAVAGWPADRALEEGGDLNVGDLRALALHVLNPGGGSS